MWPPPVQRQPDQYEDATAKCHKSAEVFISYSREDKDRVLDLAARLRAAGVSLWIDQGGIDGATLWGEEIVNALEGSKVLLLAVTAAATKSHNVAKEVVLVSERKGHILPVHLEPTTIPASLKYPLAGIQHIEYYNGDADANLKAILRSLSERASRSALRVRSRSHLRPTRQPRSLPQRWRRAPAQTARRRMARSPCCPSTTSARTRRPTTSATASPRN